MFFVEMSMIDSSKISVIIQGPIFRNDNHLLTTKHVIESVNRCLPNAEIILSTWENSNISGLVFDKLILNNDPGNFIVLVGGNKFELNLNRQLLSTRNGLLMASRQYAIKLRTDTIIKNLGFLRYFMKFFDFDETFRFVESRIITSNISSFSPMKSKRLFNPGDHFFFGLTSDLLNYFDLKQLKLEDINKSSIPGNSIDHNEILSSEQYFFIGFINKFMEVHFSYLNEYNKNLMEVSEKVIANNLVIVDNLRLGIESHKYPHYSYSMKRMRYFHYYSYFEWLLIYIKYSQKNILLYKILNFFYLISYLSLINLRKAAKPILFSAKKINNCIKQHFKLL